jgi:exodeoxyribonuclease VII large subunit
LAELVVIIDREKEKALFTGSGTFQAKEKIKELGSAKWIGDLKAWEVSNFAISEAELKMQFPTLDLKIQEEGESVEKSELIHSEEIVSTINGAVLPDGLSVSQFIAKVRNILSKQFSPGIYIFGVISSIKKYGNRVYLDLNDSESADARVSCVIWDNAENIISTLKKAGFELEKDLQVMFEAGVSVNPKDGRLSLSISRVVPEYTLAKIAAERDNTNNRLKSEGLFSKNKALVLPFLPRRLGLLTSAGGTVINDFRASLDQACFGFELYWYHVSVQGTESKKQILKGIRALQKVKDLDAILIFRGGGSQSELSLFNDYEIAKAVCNCKLPVLSAIGHQQDQCSVQDVSFQSFGVPKDLGRFFADIILNYRVKLKECVRLISTIGKSNFNEKFNQFRTTTKPLLSLALTRVEYQELLANRLIEMIKDLGITKINYARDKVLVFGAQSVQLSKNIVAMVGERLKRIQLIAKDFSHFVQLKEQKLGYLSMNVLNADPQNQLKRGFVLVRSIDSKAYLSKAAQLAKAKEADLQFADDIVRVVIKN